MVYTPTGTSVRPEAFPATPRAHQPELSFLGQMPKDFFRCPTCGKSVPKENRTQVSRLPAPCRPLPPAAARRPPPACRPPPAARCPPPTAEATHPPPAPPRQVPFRSVLMHVSELDCGGNGSPVFGPQTDPANPLPSSSSRDLSGTTRASRSTQFATLRQINAVLDRVGNNPDYWAELYEEQERRHGAHATRRLMGESGYPAGDFELDDQLETDGERVCFRLLQTAMRRLTVGHYKWVRATRPHIFDRVQIFLCLECSINFADAAMIDHAQTNDVLGRTFDAPSPGERYSAAAEVARYEHERPVLSSEMASEMRRALSLPQLQPRDRKREAKARPWRISLGAGEEARYSPVKALVLPALDIGRRGGAARDRLLRQPKPEKNIFVKAAANAWLSRLPKTYVQAKVGLGPVTCPVTCRLPPHASMPTSCTTGGAQRPGRGLGVPACGLGGAFPGNAGLGRRVPHRIHCRQSRAHAAARGRCRRARRHRVRRYCVTIPGGPQPRTAAGAAGAAGTG